MARILVVDDEPDLRFILRRTFEHAGHQVVDVGNGAAAMAIVNESPPDLVVTDMMMPVMNGAELIAKLRSTPATASIPIVAVSGDRTSPAPPTRSSRSPCCREEILVVVNRLLASKEVGST